METTAASGMETASIGVCAGQQVLLSPASAIATFIGIRWDGDKVRGIRVELNDGTAAQAGGYDDGAYTLTSYRFVPGETLAAAWLRDSGYGHGSVREVEFVTSHNGSLKAGAAGFDHEASLAVAGATLCGFHAWVNPDNFISGLALLVRAAASQPVVTRPWFETRSVGNVAAAKTNVALLSQTAVARYLQVRWDGDKVRGIRMQLADGTTQIAGGIDDVDYTLSSYTFAPGETLLSLSLSSSGYGDGSLRRLTFTTSTGGGFTAGPEGIDDLVTPPIAGASLLGFHAWVNADNFISALAFRATNDSPFAVSLRNHSPWSCTYADGAVMLDGKAVIRITDEGGNKHGLNTQHNRVVQVVSGNVSGFCAYDGSATLTVAVFGDATFEAKFPVDDGDGVVSGPLSGVAPSTAKPVLLDALVRKYAPIFMLNVDEVYWPATVDTYLPHMIVQTVQAGVAFGASKLETFYDGPLDRNILATQAARLASNNSNTGACLRTRDDLNQPSDTQDWFNGTCPGDSSAVTAYAVVVEGENNKLDITYWWFFNYNQGKTVAGTSWGNHLSDWEHVKVHLGGVDFARPQHETVLSVMYDHHGNQETHPPGDGVAEFCGSQVLVHLANGDHEAYPRAGVYDTAQGTHDYCKENAYRFDQRAGSIEIYTWNGTDFSAVPDGATPAFKDPAWLRYRGRWGNWQRGSLLGLVSQLESGPEGIFRPSEYAVPS